MEFQFLDLFLGNFERQFLSNSPPDNSESWRKNIRRECPVQRHRNTYVS